MILLDNSRQFHSENFGFLEPVYYTIYKTLPPTMKNGGFFPVRLSFIVESVSLAKIFLSDKNRTS